MGYNTFGNILFYGLGMYLCASVQVGMFFPLAEWTESGGENVCAYSITIFQGMAAGLAVAAIVPTLVAGLIGYSILGLRGHYFAICTLGLGVAAVKFVEALRLLELTRFYYKFTVSRCWWVRGKRRIFLFSKFLRSCIYICCNKRNLFNKI